jgi:hypothetical protein
MVKSRKMRSAGNVARIGEKRSKCRLLVEETAKKTEYVGGWIMLRWILKRFHGAVWTGVIWLRIGTSGGLL